MVTAIFIIAIATGFIVQYFFSKIVVLLRGGLFWKLYAIATLFVCIAAVIFLCSWLLNSRYFLYPFVITVFIPPPLLLYGYWKMYSELRKVMR
jgi:hypothetical protein